MMSRGPSAKVPSPDESSTVDSTSPSKQSPFKSRTSNEVKIEPARVDTASSPKSQTALVDAPHSRSKGTQPVFETQASKSISLFV